jgi:hypothetical protein
MMMMNCLIFMYVFREVQFQKVKRSAVLLTAQFKYNLISVNMKRAELARQVGNNNKIKF